ncbi:MAG: hypothetical protein C0602_07495 [Denitrovibrio sp.]|nr:MAG: hypothetical protein C0602_07495 [Denitrovibrio sp.]
MIIIFAIEDDKGLESLISSEFSDTPCFYWVNVETEESGCIDNRGRHVDDSGKASAKQVGDLEAEAIVVKEIGCAAVNRLRGAGVTAYLAQADIIKDNLEMFNSGKLSVIRAGECDSSCK